MFLLNNRRAALPYVRSTSVSSRLRSARPGQSACRGLTSGRRIVIAVRRFSIVSYPHRELVGARPYTSSGRLDPGVHRTQVGHYGVALAFERDDILNLLKHR